MGGPVRSIKGSMYVTVSQTLCTTVHDELGQAWAPNVFVMILIRPLFPNLGSPGPTSIGFRPIQSPFMSSEPIYVAVAVEARREHGTFDPIYVNSLCLHTTVNTKILVGTSFVTVI